MQYLEFLRDRLGPNWVVARRTLSIVRRYGEDVSCVSPAGYANAAREYRRVYGDPHDAVRQELYLAAKAIAESTAIDFADDAKRLRLNAALEAEANVK